MTITYRLHTGEIESKAKLVFNAPFGNVFDEMVIMECESILKTVLVKQGPVFCTCRISSDPKIVQDSEFTV